MKIIFSILTTVFFLFTQISFADSVVRQSANSDNFSVIAYNSTDHEYLVVWSESIKMGSFYITGPIMGQRISENGSSIGNAFTIFSQGAFPSVAYNSSRNEYLVVCATAGSIYGQRINNLGNLIETASNLDRTNQGTMAKIVYNQLMGDYLLLTASLEENPNGSGFYNIKIISWRIDSLGKLYEFGYYVEDAPYGSNEYNPYRFAIAYAPIQSYETPRGRFFLAVQTNGGINLTMLNSDGAPIDVVYDPQSQQRFRYIPFQEGSVVGGEFNVDVAFGMRAGYNLPGPAFFVVWGDNNNTWQSQEWTGIYGSFVDPYKLNYLTTDPVQDNSFPISAIYDHFAFSSDEYAKSWKPKVAYNSAGQKFIVTWRETPTTNALNDTKVNHIRADKEYTGGSYYTPNDVLSATSGNENPKNPAIASSTINPTALITWDDYRNFSTTDCDIYGNIYTIQSVPSITVTKPDGGESWYFDIQYEITWTSNSYSNPVRIEYSTDGGATYIEIINSTPNDGSYLWKVPFTISDYCVVKISDATDSDPFDISDRVFKITTTNKIVTNTNDSGLGSLRQAILDANNDPGMDTIIFKIPGTSVHTIQPLSALPIITDPVLIDGFTQPGSTPNTNPVSQGCNAYLNIELDGTYAGGNANGLDIHSGNSIIRGLIINRFDSCGIMINYFGSNKIEGNYIGSNSSGNSYIGNFIGIQIRNCPNNIIGGLTPATRNVIGGNSMGIYITEYYATNNQVLGNFIGVDITGLNSCGQYNNIHIWDSPANIIGGDIEAARNIISGGGSLYSSEDPPIGGINIGGHYSSGNIVKGNYIGTNVYGTEAILNNQAGITVMGDNTTIENNLISGNAVGIFISNVQNLIRKNFIGSLTDGVTPLGNGDGIVIRGSLNVIGGSTIDLGNVIAFNKRDGVRVEEVASQNLIQCNSIFSNQGLGINLVVADGGVTANDPGDIDDGPNFLQNYPVLTNVEVDIGTFITGSLNSTPNTTYRIDFYSSPVGDPSGFGEGKTHLGWTQITTDGNGDVDFYTGIGTVVPPGHVIATTATDPYGNTSEFSN